jgi:CubicO group peptidase (beta-lactamase class C family)
LLHLARCALISLVLGCSATSAGAMAQPAEALAPPSRAEIATEPLPGLEAFVDGIVETYLKQHQIGGAQVSIVRNRQTLLVKGYGLASIGPERAVDPQQSLFRIGSISKTFTWIAIMQLVERGQIALDDAVNDHLPDALRIPDGGYSQPIRIVDLMNHSAGFEDVIQGLFNDDPSTLLPLNESLRRFRPARVREPGRLLAYSNYGVALAGALIAHVSGTEFERYMDENILAPLGMKHTTFREELEPGLRSDLPAPMPAPLAQHKAQGLEHRNGAWKAYPQEHLLSHAPAGSVVSTAADMARYMTALLNPELLELAGVLRESSYEQMRQPSFQGAPGLPAVHHGFFNLPLGETRALGFDNLSHSGGTMHFQSLLALIPAIELPDGTDAGALGIFVTTNSGAGALLAQALPEQILTKYFVSAATDAIEPVAQPHALSDYVGEYRTLRRSFTKLEKLFALGQTVRVTASADGFLSIAAHRQPLRMVEIADDLFRQQNGDQIVAFRRDSKGKVVHAITVAGTADRVRPLDSLAWLLAISAAALLATLGVMAGVVRRRRYAQSETHGEAWSSRWLAIAAAVWLAFWILFIVWIVSVAGPDGLDQFMLTYPDALLKAALAVLLLASIMSLTALATLLPVWRGAGWTRWRRIRHTAAVATLVAFVATAAHLNALGFGFY